LKFAKDRRRLIFVRYYRAINTMKRRIITKILTSNFHLRPSVLLMQNHVD